MLACKSHTFNQWVACNRKYDLSALTYIFKWSYLDFRSRGLYLEWNCHAHYAKSDTEHIRFTGRLMSQIVMGTEKNYPRF